MGSVGLSALHSGPVTRLVSSIRKSNEDSTRCPLTLESFSLIVASGKSVAMCPAMTLGTNFWKICSIRQQLTSKALIVKIRTPYASQLLTLFEGTVLKISWKIWVLRFAVVDHKISSSSERGSATERSYWDRVVSS